jgi:heme A synthase
VTVGFLISLLIVALIIGVVWWGIQQIAMPPPIKTIITVIFVIFVVLILVGLLTGHWQVPINLPR